PGFTPAELAHLQNLVLGHRGKLKKMEAFMHLPSNAEQLLCLRLAAVLCSNRRAPELQGVQLQRRDKQLLLQMPAGWAQRFPLSTQLLREETEAIGKSDWELVLQLD
ncbi:MAG: exopolyphosphatase, partial [Comamonadaceae bacterium]|nr:exopolyphosphatase [Comamonadaceae bacterium]